MTQQEQNALQPVDRWLAMAEEHGFTAHIAENRQAVHVDVHYVTAKGRHGVVVEIAKNWYEMRTLLGY